MDDGKVRAPWSDEQVLNLTAWQADGRFHPFTCPNLEKHHAGGTVLIARPDGWHCPHCGYRQDWAWAHMTRPTPPGIQPQADADADEIARAIADDYLAVLIEEKEFTELRCKIAEAIRTQTRHWREHCKAVDSLCDRLKVPASRPDGSRIFTEDRVRIIVSRMMHMGELLTEVSDGLEDEGDRVYLGTTNHKDLLRDMAQRYFEWCHLETKAGDDHNHTS